MWLFKLFMTKTICSPLHSQFASCQNTGTKVFSSAKMNAVTAYPQVENYLLRAYATYGNIVDAEHEISFISAALSMAPARSAEALIGKAPLCGDVYEQQNNDKAFFKGPSRSVRPTMHGDWSIQ